MVEKRGAFAMDKILLYKIAYRYLSDVTPLKIDCGSLCRRACCNGDSETGMHLFPGEEILQIKHTHISIKAINNKADNAPARHLAVCNSSCLRSLRPLSCRIFPLVPYLTSNGRLEIKMDPRAFSMCPLARHSSIEELNRIFIMRVRKVFQLLLKDRDIYDYVVYLSELQDEFENLQSIFYK